MKALILIQDEVLELTENKDMTAQHEPRQTVVVIALHNIAVQYEYLNQYQSAIHTYQKSFDYSRKHLGDSHPFTQKMEKVLQESTSKIKSIIEK